MSLAPFLSSFLQRASSPRIDPDERDRLLSFVIVGGGPTSIEFAASLHDFCRQDVRKWYPELYPHVRLTVVEAGDFAYIIKYQNVDTIIVGFLTLY